MAGRSEACDVTIADDVAATQHLPFGTDSLPSGPRHQSDGTEGGGQTLGPAPSWAAWICVLLGVFGATVALSGLFAALPAPGAGGTCGPGQSSEAAIVALLDPVTIGAGAEPPASQAAPRKQWRAFVDECQTAADNRALVAFPILVVSIGVAVVGILLQLRRSRRGRRPGPGERIGVDPAQSWPAPFSGPPPPPPSPFPTDAPPGPNQPGPYPPGPGSAGSPGSWGA